MAETEAAAAPAATTPAPKKTKGSSKPRKPKSAPSHPKVSEMVNAAIGDLKEKGGSSLQAIKKYIASHYKVDMDRLTPFVRKYLKNAVASGALVQTKGKGASGSFKMSGPKGEKAKKPEGGAKKAKISEKKAGKKAATPRKPKSAVKKPKKPKAAATKKPKTSKPKATKPKKPKSPAKKVKAKK